MSKSPAEIWADATGKQMRANHLARAACEAWRAAVPTYSQSFLFWLGAEADTT